MNTIHDVLHQASGDTIFQTIMATIDQQYASIKRLAPTDVKVLLACIGMTNNSLNIIDRETWAQVIIQAGQFANAHRTATIKTFIRNVDG